MLKKFFITFSFTSIIATSNCHASGIPVFDGANLSQIVTEYTQQLEDYATQLEQLEQQTKQWEQKVKDTAKPFSDFYNKASTLMKKGMDLYQYSTNLAEQFSSAESFLDSTIGSKESWAKCAIDINCNPADKLFDAYSSLSNKFSNANTKLLALTDHLSENTQSIAEQLSSEVANCEGERCIQESQAKAQGAKMSLDAEYQQAHLNYMKEDLAIRKAEIQAKKMQELKTTIFMERFSGVY